MISDIAFVCAVFMVTLFILVTVYYMMRYGSSPLTALGRQRIAFEKRKEKRVAQLMQLGLDYEDAYNMVKNQMRTESRDLAHRLRSEL